MALNKAYCEKVGQKSLWTPLLLSKPLIDQKVINPWVFSPDSLIYIGKYFVIQSQYIFSVKLLFRFLLSAFLIDWDSMPRKELTPKVDYSPLPKILLLCYQHQSFHQTNACIKWFTSSVINKGVGRMFGTSLFILDMVLNWSKIIALTCNAISMGRGGL